MIQIWGWSEASIGIGFSQPNPTWVGEEIPRRAEHFFSEQRASKQAKSFLHFLLKQFLALCFRHQKRKKKHRKAILIPCEWLKKKILVKAVERCFSSSIQDRFKVSFKWRDGKKAKQNPLTPLTLNKAPFGIKKFVLRLSQSCAVWIPFSISFCSLSVHL